MSSHPPAVKAPRLTFSAIIIALSLVVTLVFASAFREAPPYVDDPTLCGNPASGPEAPQSHVDHTPKTATEPRYNAGGLWSAENNLRGLADLFTIALAGDDPLQCHSLSWHDGKLIVIDATPPRPRYSNAAEAAGLVVVSVDHFGGDIDPDFANAIRDHLNSLANAKRIAFLTPLRGPDKRPSREDPYDWSFLTSSEKISSKTVFIDFSEMKTKADLPGRPLSGALLTLIDEYLAPVKGLDKADLDGLINALANDDTDAFAALKLSLESPYLVIPRLNSWLGESPEKIRLYHGIMIRRALHVHADALIAKAAASDDTVMRRLAARAIGDLAPSTTNPIGRLTPLAEDSDQSVRYEALVACLAIPGRQAAGVAQLVEPYEMSDAMRVLYQGTMAELLTYGPPVQADSRANRLRRMDINNLLSEPRDALVCTILLERADLPDSKIDEVLNQLASINGQGPLVSLLNTLQSMNPTTLNRRDVLLDRLVGWPASELSAQSPRLKEMALNAGSIRLRSAASAAMAMSSSPQAVLAALGDDPIVFVGLMRVGDPAVQKKWSDAIMQQITKSQPLATTIAAIDAAATLPADALTTDKITTLMRLARESSEIDLRFAAIRTINALPASVRPGDIDDLKLTALTISAVPAQMKYDKAKLTVTAGRPVELTLLNPDTMEHNLVITLPGRAQEIGIAMSADPTAAAAIGYVPRNSDAVLYYTAMTTPGTSDTLRFIAPSKPGNYEYVCTFPGHYTSMRGILEVVAP